MAAPEFRMAFPDLGAMQREIQTNIRFGRVFLSEVVEAPVLSDGVLVLIHPDGRELRLAAQVVMVNPDGPMRGTGIALRAFGPQDVGMVEAFAAEMQALVANENGREITAEVPTFAAAIGREELAPAFERSEHVQQADPAEFEDHQDIGEADTAVHELTAEVAALRAELHARERQKEAQQEPAEAWQADADTLTEALAPAVGEDACEDADDASADTGELLANEGVAFDEDPDFDPSLPASEPQAESRQARLRALSPVQQLKLARKAELADRVLLERLFGKHVWEGLLTNPRITQPEVARIARKGSVPRLLLELIWENGNWIKDATVRRALLGNPKTTPEAVVKLLRLMPRHELKQLEKGTAYSQAVRETARKILKD